MYKDFNKYDKIVLFLILSLFAGQYGGGLQLVRVIGIGCLPLFLSTIDKIPTSYINPPKKVVSFFLIFSMISLIWSGDISLGAKDILYSLIHFVVFLEIIAFSYKANNPITSISTGWSCALLITTIIAFWELHTGQHLSTSKFDSDATLNFEGMKIQRIFAAATFYNYNQFEVFICYCTPFLLLLIQYTKKQSLIVLQYVLLGLSFYVVVTNASRSAMLAIVIYYSMSLSNIFRRGGRSILINIVLICALLYVLHRYSYTIFENLSRRIVASGYESSRFDIWKQHWDALKDTLFMGYGVGGMNFSESMLSTAISAPHNMFLEVLLKFGIVGFGVLFYCLYFLYKNSNIIENKSFRTIVLSIFIAMPAFFVTNSTYLMDASFYIFFASLYVIIFIWMYKNNTYNS